MEEFNEEMTRRRRIIRVILGLFLIFSGIVFIIIPFIPLGYLFLIVGLFFLSPIIPWLRGILEKAERKEKKGRVRKARDASEEFEKRLEGKIEKLKRKREQY